MTGDGSDTTLALSTTPTSENQTFVTIDGVVQHKDTYSISGSTLTFTTAPAANTSFFAILLGSDNGGTVTPTDESVTDDKLANTISTINNTG